MKKKISWKPGAPKGRVAIRGPVVDFAAEYDPDAEYQLEPHEAEAVLAGFPDRFEISKPKPAPKPKQKTTEEAD